MCGIIGYIGSNNDPGVGLEALKRLEYRGYDSAGMAYYDTASKKINSERAVGRVSFLEEKMNASSPEGSPFIFHTRWATHGAPTEANAHPHSDCTGAFYIVHNGIIENYQELKSWLKEQGGHKFKSETDTEILAHLIEFHYNGDLLEAVQKSLNMVVGTYGIAVISSHAPSELVAARLGSPLLVGVGEDGYFLASDPAGVIAHTKQVVYLEDGDIVKLASDNMQIMSQETLKEPKIEELEWDLEEAQKGGYEHFMLKEIMEQPETIRATMRGRLLPDEGNVKLGGLENVAEQLKDIERIHIIACGTAYYAGMTGKYMLEEYAGIPTEVDIGSEFRYRKSILDKEKTAALFISQSGETADTIAPLKEVKNKGVLTLGIVNVVGSTIAREVDAGIYNHAGPEIGVASTKAFTSQLTALAMLSVFLGRQRGLSHSEGVEIVEEIEKLPEIIKGVLESAQDIKKLAQNYKDTQNMLYLGRKYNYPVALEGALKIKEISYIHAEGYAGGEMKHGPIALIDENFPTVALMPEDSVFEKMASNIEELKARKGTVIAVATEGSSEAKRLADDIMYVPESFEMLSPIVNVIPMQLFAYYVGVARGHNVDKPRNLAKSVTVE
ncbi:MAG: glutamine--fructose-6-phosphate transaminase (isomerizing) [Candidatus Spechtbacterales bacterium]|nr:glutamine--fructose-6-phosphate transaminase (isomerizing) [Candidatus Spechtbacterales bacterium]